MTARTGTLAIRGRLLSFDADPAVEAEPHAVMFLEDGIVVVKDGVIVEIGEGPALARRLPPGVPLVDHRPHLVMAGFIDPHLHMPQTQVIASYGTELMAWLSKYTFPEELRYGDSGVAEEASRFLFDTLAANGTTTAAVYCTSHQISAEAFFHEADRRGLRMIAGKVMMDRGAPQGLLDTAESGYEQTKELAAAWHGRGRLEVAITPRFAPTSSEAQLEATGALAAEFPGLPIQTHLSENHGEIAFVADAFPWSKDYTDVYEHYGLVRPRALFGHCIHLSDRERTALASKGASAIFCPTSNLFLGSGLYDLAASRRLGLTTGIATDIGGGTSYSMLTTAAEGYKVLALKGQKWPAFEAFHMMTAGNAAAVGIADKVGRLAVGLEADLVVLDSRASEPMRRRMARVETLAEELFALMVLGDDRATVATYAMGRKIYDRYHAGHATLAPKLDQAPWPQPGEGGGSAQ
ncbi:guanine deaminase [Jiella sp. MQZ9-1]|uniref:Guanine deaminase n=1 Tax=Jiella flava TaxID=2816857 RepID=A0A939JUU1_9HYPH|nr:guanine deaminase [Jiella flava]MBO0661312.1 guanine deaminase [Jiella flava]MCD2469956.1 guanine deaminase [Jiella flava]